MGRFPFTAIVNDYLGVMDSAFAESTLKRLRVRFKRMDEDFRSLILVGKIKTANPNKFSDLDIIEYIGLMRRQGMKDGGIKHNIDALSGLLGFLGNGAMERAKKRFPQHFPHNNMEMLDPISDEGQAKIVNYASQVPDEDWHRMEAYAITIAGMCTGLRPQELRPAKLYHLNLDKGTMHTDEVKGKKRYGKPRDTAIHPDGIPFLRRYVKTRAMVLKKRGLKTDLLFPSLKGLKQGRGGMFTADGTRNMREIVKDETDIDYDFRTCRRTWVQRAIDDGVPVDAVSRMAGHETTKTTETFYGRKKNNKAVAEAQAVWTALKPTEPVSAPQLPEKINSPLIDSKERLPGYW